MTAVSGQQTRVLIDNFMTENHIGPEYQRAMHSLNRYQRILIVDDSGSMRDNMNSSYKGNDPVTGQIVAHPCVQRCREAARNIQENAVLALALDPDSTLDVYFLNQENKDPTQPLTKVKMVQDFTSLLSQIGGLTPLLKTVRNVIAYINVRLHGEEKFLLDIHTDGDPSDGKFGDLIQEIFQDAVVRDNLAICINITTNDKRVIQYYKKEVDETDIPGTEKGSLRVDVVAPFINQKKMAEEDAKAQGKENFTYKFSDWIVARLGVGAVDKEVDRLNEGTAALNENDIVFTEADQANAAQTALQREEAAAELARLREEPSTHMQSAASRVTDDQSNGCCTLS